MASPLVDDPVDLGARIVRGSLRRQRVFRDRGDPLAFPDDILYERYRFSSEGIHYICSLVEPSVRNATERSCALTVGQTVCVALRFFATGTYMVNFIFYFKETPYIITVTVTASEGADWTGAARGDSNALQTPLIPI